MIEEFEKKSSPAYVETVVRGYGLTLAHKHAPEMKVHGKLSQPPVFAPNVGQFYRGMIVEVPLQLWALPGKPAVADLQGTLENAYDKAELVKVANLYEAAELKASELLAGRNDMQLYVFGNDKTRQARLVAVFDNLGKGAGGRRCRTSTFCLVFPKPRV